MKEVDAFVGAVREEFGQTVGRVLASEQCAVRRALTAAVSSPEASRLNLWLHSKLIDSLPEGSCFTGLRASAREQLMKPPSRLSNGSVTSQRRLSDVSVTAQSRFSDGSVTVR